MDTHLILLLLTCLSGPCLAENVTMFSGQLGDNLTIFCPYIQRTYHWSKKLWCKEDWDGHCQSVVSTRAFKKKRTIGNSTIFDNFSDGVVEISLKHLQQEDAGMYQCQSVYFGDVQLLKRVQVLVLENYVYFNLSDMGKVQHSISGSSSRSIAFWNFIIIGSSLLIVKLLILILIHIWGKSHYKRRVDPGSNLLSSAAELLPDETGDLNSHTDGPHVYTYEIPIAIPVYIDEIPKSTPMQTDEIPRATSVYINMMTPLNQAHWQRKS
ncbi:uncharacterized protein O3C94_002446 [Discoglossus pictus]